MNAKNLPPKGPNTLELIEAEDGVRTLIPVTLETGEGVGMYEYARYIDDTGEQRVILSGVTETELPDGSVGIPAQVVTPDQLDAYKQRIPNSRAKEMASRALEVVGTEEPKVDARKGILEGMPILREYVGELNRIAEVRNREHESGSRYGMGQHDSSEAMIHKLIASVRQIYKYKPGEDLEGAIRRYLDALT